MKQTLFNILSVLVLILSLTNTPLPAFASATLQELKATVTPTSISYQGMVKVDGAPYTGTGYFKFAIVSADGNTSRWSNDGSSTGGNAPTNPVPLPVSDGLFSVRLGDTSLTGMSRVIDGQTMWTAGKDCRLRVWFSPDGVSAYVLLSPDRPFSSAPFALVSEYAVESSSLDGYTVSDFASAIHYHNDLYQPLMDNICPAGYAIQSIDSTGGYTCASMYAKPGYEINSVDSVGWYTSMAIGADGLPIISYYDTVGFNLKVAHCNDLTCSSATITTLDSAGSVGQSTSITIGGDGLALISYRDYTNSTLKVAHCSNTECTAATISTIDNTANVGDYTSITTNYLGRGLISYIDLTNSDLKVASCSNTLCTSATRTTLDTDAAAGYTSITLTPAGTGIISYRNGAGNLKVAHCQSSSCTSATLYTVESSTVVGSNSSITIGTDGYPIISYYDSTNGDLKVAHCTDVTCSSSEKFTVYSSNDAGKYSSIIIGSDGLAVIAFNATEGSGSGFLKVAHCSTFACDQSRVVTMDSDLVNTGEYTSIAVGMDGLPVISYYQENPSALLVAHCANTLCGSYRRGR